MTLSYSRARTFDECPFKFKVQYIDKVQHPEESYLTTGSLVHEVLDRYTKHLQSTKQSSDFPSMEVLSKMVWQEPAFRKDLPESAWPEVLELCIQARESLVFEHISDIQDSELKLAVDTTWRAVPYDSPKAHVRGRVDRLDINDEGIATITDYKTGNRIDGIPGNKQLGTYAGLVLANWPDLDATRLRVCLNYVRHEIVKAAMFDPAELEEVKEWYPGIERGIKLCEKSGMWPARPGQACRGCAAFKDCPERQRAVHAVPPENEGAAARLVERLILLDREREETTDALRPWIDQYGSIEVNGMVMGLFPEKRLEYDAPKVWTLLEGRGFSPMQYMRVDTKELKKIGRKDRTLAAELVTLAEDRSITKLKLKVDKEDD